MGIRNKSKIGNPNRWNKNGLFQPQKITHRYQSETNKQGNIFRGNKVLIGCGNKAGIKTELVRVAIVDKKGTRDPQGAKVVRSQQPCGMVNVSGWFPPKRNAVTSEKRAPPLKTKILSTRLIITNSLKGIQRSVSNNVPNMIQPKRAIRNPQVN